MATDEDSLDISQLRAIALGPVWDQSRFPAPVASTHQLPSLSAQTERLIHSKRSRLNAPTTFSPESVRQYLSSSHADHASNLKAIASPPELPSTIPDSLSSKPMSHESFRGGDTQPLSQWVDWDFSNKSKTAESTAKQSQINGCTQEIEATAPATHSQDRTGLIDILGPFKQPVTAFGDELDGAKNIEEDRVAVTHADVHAEIYPELQRFQEPITPATNKWGQSEPMPPNSTTPQLPVHLNILGNGFGNDVGVMNLSQVFKATQAPSSPFMHQITSDNASERPSPAYHMQRPATAHALSSPAKLPPFGLQRAVTEPYTNYISRQESQAERDRLRSASGSNPTKPVMPDDFDDEFDSDSSQQRRRRKRQRIEEEIMEQFRGITASPRQPFNRCRGNYKPTSARRRVPKTSYTRAPDTPRTFFISDDLPADEPTADTTEDETEREGSRGTPNVDLVDELGEDNKENRGARRIQVPMTVSRTTRRKLHRAGAPQSSPVAKKHKARRNQEEIDELAAENPDHHTARQTKIVPTTKEEIAIADSQPSRPSQKKKASRAASPDAGAVPGSSVGVPVLIPRSQAEKMHSTPPNHASQVRRPAHRVQTQTPGEISGSSSKLLPSSSPQLRRSPRRKPSGPVGIKRHDKPRSPISLGSSPPQVSNARKVRSLDNAAPDDANVTITSPSAQLRKNASQHLSEAANPRFKGRPVDKSAIPASERTPSHPDATLRSTIPETSSILRLTGSVAPSPCSDNDDRLPVTSSPNQVAGPTIGVYSKEQSNNSTAFETAQTHLAESPTHLRVQRLRGSHASISSTKANPVKIMAFTAIAADSSPRDDSGEIDVDVMTAEDVAFQALVEGPSSVGPARKRRRGRFGKSIRETEASDQFPSAAVTAAAEGETRNGFRPVVASNDRHDRTLGIGDCGPQVVVGPGEDPKTSGTKPTTTAPAEGPSSSNAEAEAIRSKPRLQSVKDQPTDQLACPKIIDTVVPVSHPRRAGRPPKGITIPKISSPAIEDRANTVAPNRVFAHFNGKNCVGYWPASCIGAIVGTDLRYRVRFDDGNIDVVGSSQIRRLELRVGDTVKFDEAEVRTHNYTVMGLVPQPTVSKAGRVQSPRPSKARMLPQTDVSGHSKVRIQLQQKKSISHPESRAEEMTVPLANIYLTSTLWSSFKDRPYTYHSGHPLPPSSLQTPSDRPSTPASPCSRTRRIKSAAQSHLLLHHHSIPTDSVAATASGLFSSMVFSISNVDDAATRQQTMQAITRHGGRILADGFHQLFDCPPPSPTGSSAVPPLSPSPPALQLNRGAARSGFCCLIADRHCRNQKFFQALALGIPCLATRWVNDCLRREEVLPWEAYLLPSGESTFLGTVRTRLLPRFGPESVTLQQIVDGRVRLLDGASVLLVMGRDQVMHAWPFIAYALGAKMVGTTATVESARGMVERERERERDGDGEGGNWDWVFYYAGEKQVGGGRKEGKGGKGGGGRKRKRGDGGGGGDGDWQGLLGGGAGGGGTRVVTTEFVVQSLILGQLVDEGL